LYINDWNTIANHDDCLFIAIEGACKSWAPEWLLVTKEIDTRREQLIRATNFLKLVGQKVAGLEKMGK